MSEDKQNYDVISYFLVFLRLLGRLRDDFFLIQKKTLISYPQELLHSKGVELIKFLISLYWMCFYQFYLILRFLGCFFFYSSVHLICVKDCFFKNPKCKKNIFCSWILSETNVLVKSLRILDSPQIKHQIKLKNLHKIA